MLLLLLLLLLKLGEVESRPLRDTKIAWLIRALQYMEANPETLEELMSQGLVVLEGDLVLPSDRNVVASSWPTPRIAYVVSPDLAARMDDLAAAMAMVSEKTCVTFHQRTNETDYLRFQTSTGCASYLGFRGGEQPVFIGPLCIVGNIVHEIYHALGFHHEHTRSDRDRHVTIFSHNVMQGMERNFRRVEGQTFELPYDTASIMHYGSHFFSAKGLPTILPLDPAEDMGQRVRLTPHDIQRVRRLYNCGEWTRNATDAEFRPESTAGEDEQR